MIQTISPPKELGANKLYRATLLQWADSPARQQQIRQRCKEDVIWWIDSFGWQYNPDARGHEVEPFICYDFQEQGLRRTMRRLLHYRLPMVWEKSRKLGASWLMIFMELQQCLFWDRQKFLNLSHNEDAVNNPDDPDTLFWKARFILDYLPEWQVDARKLRKSFWFRNTRSSITASATTVRAGVGGRGVVLADEFSKHPKAYQILGQTVDTGPQLFVGTHYGIGGAFYDLTIRPDMVKEVWHWSLHPERKKGLYRSDPVLPRGYEVLDKDFEYGNQCSNCLGLTDVLDGEPTECCAGKGTSRPFVFDTSGKPLGGPFPGIRSPYYDFECRKRNNERDVAMHLDINPQGSQSAFFSSIILRKYADKLCGPPLWRGDIDTNKETGMATILKARDDGPLKLWMNPKGDLQLPYGLYGGGADIANGTGKTPSVFSAGNAKDCHKVLEYANANIYPHEFALVVHALCWLLLDIDGTPCYLCFESNGSGGIFSREILGYNYRRLYKPYEDQLLVKAAAGANKVGWTNNPNSLRILMDSYKGALYEYDLINPSREAIEECPMFRHNAKTGVLENSKAIDVENPEDMGQNHADRVMADAQMWLAMKKLGAGRVLKAAAAELPAPRGSFLWRRQQRQSQAALEERWA